MLGCVPIKVIFWWQKSVGWVLGSAFGMGPYSMFGWQEKHLLHLKRFMQQKRKTLHVAFLSMTTPWNQYAYVCSWLGTIKKKIAAQIQLLCGKKKKKHQDSVPNTKSFWLLQSVEAGGSFIKAILCDLNKMLLEQMHEYNPGIWIIVSTTFKAAAIENSPSGQS